MHDVENIQILDNPDDVSQLICLTYLQSDDNEDISSIIEYQHKILRKYTMMGMINYFDAPLFHDLADQRDYKMISIFEVFAINRSEEDFLENLNIFKLFIDQDDQSPTDEDAEQETEALVDPDLNNPNIQIVFQMKDRLGDDIYNWCKQAVKDNVKNVMSSINAWIALKDDADLVDSLKRVYRLNNKK